MLANRIFIVTAICCAALTAHAEIGNPAGDSPLTPDSSASPKGMNNADQLFVQLVGMGGKAEVEAGNTAAHQGKSDLVQDFGRRMAKDHQNANQKLEKLAQSDHIEIEKNYDPDHQRQSKYLSGLKGDEFDREYIRTQIAEHQRTALLLEWEIGSGQNKALKQYAEDTLPTVLEHLQMAKDTLQQLKTT